MNKDDSSFLRANLFTMVGQVRIRTQDIEESGKRGGKISYLCVKMNLYFKLCTKPPLPFKFQHSICTHMTFYHPSSLHLLPVSMYTCPTMVRSFPLKKDEKTFSL